MIPYGKQSISEEDVEAVAEVLRSDYLTCGPRVEAFENAFAEMCGAEFAVACSNGTAALHLAMLATGVGEGDRVITTPITFLASANAGRYVGAEVDFCDIEPETATLGAAFLEDSWRDETNAVVGVDYAGHPADFEAISKVASERGAVVIEDACHAVGGRWKKADEEYRVGSLPWVDAATFSFHPVKTLTTGEGGMVTTNNPEIAERARLLRSHGMVRKPDKFQLFGTSGALSEVGDWAYEMQELGFNYRLTDLQCALGISQLKRLPEFIERRQQVVSKYNEAFAELELLKTPSIGPWIGDENELSWHLYPVRVDFKSLGKSKKQFAAELREKGIGSQVHYIPVSEQPYYRSEGVHFPNANSFYDSVISLPLFPSMTDSDSSLVCEAVSDLLN
ncbi:MAG: UDP-4-amino-4,6-dideoxy-N-acetyl-beta-L-altrosamine transaminase [Verrucomicrobiales bacterium]|nr:UDP-4-amino-4,6-dideoxy-N-acetyl-beta-L-altrosamine transaminase [Verrucomicrobiales bacterium]